MRIGWTRPPSESVSAFIPANRSGRDDDAVPRLVPEGPRVFPGQGRGGPDPGPRGVQSPMAKEKTQIDVELAGLAQDRRSAAASLNALLGRSEDAPLGPALSAPAIRTPDKGTVEKDALERSPELAMGRAAARRDRSRQSR